MARGSRVGLPAGGMTLRATREALRQSFDAVLIDIDKEDYIDALEAAIPRVRPGGLILADNVLWGGMTAQQNAAPDPVTDVLKAFNERIVSDPRLLTGILPCGDGLSVSLVQRRR